jgi:hypothetical protein
VRNAALSLRAYSAKKQELPQQGDVNPGQEGAKNRPVLDPPSLLCWYPPTPVALLELRQLEASPEAGKSVF